MAPRHPVRRRATKTVAHRSRPKRSLAGALSRAAASKPAKATYVAVGTIGLAALAVAILGPRRLKQQVFKPLQNAMVPQAEKLWDQARPVRSQLAGILRRAGTEREKLAGDLQSWIGHFRAS